MNIITRSEPKLNDIGVRRLLINSNPILRSEPRLNDIGVRLKPMNGLSILPVLIEVETSLEKIIRKKVR